MIMFRTKARTRVRVRARAHPLLQRAALPHYDCLVLALTLTLVLALVRNITIFSKARVLVLNQPITSEPKIRQPR